ncbi:hypothetical protein D9M70_587650 [compost metagenome]
MAEVAVAQDKGGAIGPHQLPRGAADDLRDAVQIAGQGQFLDGPDQAFEMTFVADRGTIHGTGLQTGR